MPASGRDERVHDTGSDPIGLMICGEPVEQQHVRPGPRGDVGDPGPVERCKAIHDDPLRTGSRVRPMTLKVVGAGLGRTGTHSLKAALEQLLGGPCYHMSKSSAVPTTSPYGKARSTAKCPTGTSSSPGTAPTVDWPAARCWREISAKRTRCGRAAVVPRRRRRMVDERAQHDLPDHEPPRTRMRHSRPLRWHGHRDVPKSFTPDWQDETKAKRAYEQHNADVRAAVPADRLIDYQPATAGRRSARSSALAVPSEPFPHINTTDEFRAMVGMEPLT